MLDIGREWRYDLYDLDLELPQPLVAPEKRREVDERLDARGDVVSALTDAELERLMEDLKSLDVEAVAVCLLHCVRERCARARILAAAGTQTLARTSRCSFRPRSRAKSSEFERMSTTVAECLRSSRSSREYLRRLDAARAANLAPTRRSHHGLERRFHIRRGCGGDADPAARIRSGGGRAFGAQHRAEQRRKPVLAFDMGGTTAKACVAVGGEPLDRAQSSRRRACIASSAARVCRC